ncbi:MAG TPA: valine--tRNA ligase [Candidatus Binatia bacterium]|nr:valine--tRNA ligase [Candidatus Binatia bacterium]
MPAVRSIDPATLPKHFDAADAEARWSRAWEERKLYAWDPSRGRADTFVVDTPPPTVSGSLHVGHVFSYTQTDVLVRHQRMRGRNIYYPMGWDDNGLPTERRVQNYFHVRCDPHAPRDPARTIEPPTAAELKGPPRLVSRPEFIELCLRLTREDERAFEQLWRRLGLSVDWAQQYATIDRRARQLAQLSFLDLLAKGHAYSVEAPTMWDVDFQTAVAQAEVEDRQVAGAFHHVAFGVEGSDASFTIATTRPELLAACVGVTAHPDDARFKPLFGRRAVTPLFRVPVPIFPSPAADPEKGTGILMVCTFGDATDVAWWRDEKLRLRQIVGRDGRLVPVRFGTEGWESLDPEAANRFYAELAGKTIAQARRRVAELLREPAGAAAGTEPPLRGEPVPIQHAVKFYEKGDRPLEFISTRQWFVRLLDKKEALLAKGDQIRWHPDFMRLRYRNWTENLNVDWCVSRQRYFGVPIPVWYPLDASGRPDHARPIVADANALPVDPTTDAPPGFDEAQRGRPGGFVGEEDVFDTWFTSSLTPQIGSGWLLDPARHRQLFPADIRPQSHEIIRTWAFYTIAKALLHEDTIPWRHVVVSGWILDPDRKKMSKSRGNVVTPAHLLDEYTADGVRYWAASARLGTDTAFDDKVFKVGRRLVTKIFNAGKYVLQQAGPVAPVTAELDRAFVARLRALIGSVTNAFDEFDYAHALQQTESFFWADFTDTFLELAKGRARAGDGSAVAALRTGLSVLLRLFAPVLPYITEEVWSWAFATETGHASIHRAPWPTVAELAGVAEPEDPQSFAAAVAYLAAINKAKSEAGVSAGREVARLRARAARDVGAALRRVEADVMAAARVRDGGLVPGDGLAAGGLEVVEIEFAEPAPT